METEIAIRRVLDRDFFNLTVEQIKKSLWQLLMEHRKTKQEMMNLQSRLDTSLVDKARIESENEHLRKKISENEHLRKKLSDNQSVRSNLVTENEKYKKKVCDLQKAQDDMCKSLSMCKNEYKNLEKEKNKLKDEKKELEDQCKLVEKESKEVESDNIQLDSENKQVKDENRTLKSENEILCDIKRTLELMYACINHINDTKVCDCFEEKVAMLRRNKRTLIEKLNEFYTKYYEFCEKRQKDELRTTIIKDEDDISDYFSGETASLDMSQNETLKLNGNPIQHLEKVMKEQYYSQENDLSTDLSDDDGPPVLPIEGKVAEKGIPSINGKPSTVVKSALNDILSSVNGINSEINGHSSRLSVTKDSELNSAKKKTISEPEAIQSYGVVKRKRGRKKKEVGADQSALKKNYNPGIFGAGKVKANGSLQITSPDGSVICQVTSLDKAKESQSQKVKMPNKGYKIPKKS